MTAEGYKADPLSDEMERRIQNRITWLRANSGGKKRPLSEVSAEIYAAAALEWVLNEAESLKHEVLTHHLDLTCPDCGHVHAGENECEVKIGGGRECRCERKVTA